MASLVLGVAGAVALGPAGLAWGGMLGMSGAQIGFTVGSMLGSSLTKLPDVQGPRMADLKVQASTYGSSIPIYYGTGRGAGQVMWSSDLIETEHEEEAGKGGPSQSVTTYTYSVNCAVAVCAAEISGIRKIWANGNLIFDQSTTNSGPTGQSNNIRVYTGSETQVADSLLESYLGAGNVPGFRGLAYVVFENLQLEKFGNRIPNFSFEVVADGDVSTPTHTKLTETTVIDAMPHPFIDGIYLSTSADNGGTEPIVLHITDAIANTDRTMDIADIPSSNDGGYMCYVAITNEIWINTDAIYHGYSSDIAIAYDASTLAFKRRITPGAYVGFHILGGNIFYDRTFHKVLFATGGSTVTDGYNALDPISLLWDGKKNTDMVVDWYTGRGIAGDNSIALSHYNPYICFFINGQYVHNQPITSGSPCIAYDTRRNRYAWYDRNASSKSVFRTVDDDGIFEMSEHAPDTPAILTLGSFDYFPIADKYILSDNDTLSLLNAETFETESSWPLFVFVTGNAYGCMEIPGVPEYLVAYVTNPSSGLALVPLTDRLSSNPVSLSGIVADICARVGLDAGDIDVSSLTDEVYGYTIAQQMPGRAAIDGLQAAFYFDAVESD